MGRTTIDFGPLVGVGILVYVGLRTWSLLVKHLQLPVLLAGVLALILTVALGYGIRMALRAADEESVGSRESAVSSQQSAVSGQESRGGSRQPAVGGQESGVGGQGSAVGSPLPSARPKGALPPLRRTSGEEGT